MKKVYEIQNQNFNKSIEFSELDYIIQSTTYKSNSALVNIWIIPMTNELYGMRDTIIKLIRAKKLISAFSYVPLFKHFYKYRIFCGKRYLQVKQLMGHKIPEELSLIVSDYTSFPPL
jgi:hypothetical protein